MSGSMLRNVAERASRGLSFWRRMPADLGRVRLRVSPESGGLRYWRFDLDRVDDHLLRLAREFVKPGASVWDIGANVGLLTFASAYLAGANGAVLAVEPDVDNQRLIQQSIRANKGRIAPVDLIGAAVSNGPARFAKFAIADRSRSSNALAGLGNSQMGGVRETRSVVLLTLDELLKDFRKPDLVKIDVEGAEVDALRGAERLLAEVRPVFLIEVADTCAEALTRILSDARYRLYNGDLPPTERTTPVDRAVWNTLAIPE